MMPPVPFPLSCRLMFVSVPATAIEGATPVAAPVTTMLFVEAVARLVVPLTFSVLERVVAPVTPSVPAMVVLPLAAVTLNLLVFTARSPVTPRVLEKVPAPVTPSVPATGGLPAGAVTLDLLVFTARCPGMAGGVVGGAAPGDTRGPPAG